MTQALRAFFRTPWCPAHPGERHSRRGCGPVPICRGPLHPSTSSPFSPLPTATQPGQAHRGAVPQEQRPRVFARRPGSRSSGCSPRSRDLAGEHPRIPRSRRGRRPCRARLRSVAFLGPGSRARAGFTFARHSGFCIFVIAYALLKDATAASGCCTAPQVWPSFGVLP
jgi:hypothetical protein